MSESSSATESRPRARLLIVQPEAGVDLSAYRLAAIERVLKACSDRPASVLIEAGLASPTPFDRPDVRTHVLGFGCPCCIGSLPLQVTLTRILRQDRPKLIILAPLPGAHQDALVTFITEKFSAFLDVEILPRESGSGPLLALNLLKGG